jgi:hypothetical protein
MAKSKIPVRPGLLINRFFKKSALAKAYKNAATWLKEATSINGRKIISGKMVLIEKNAIKISKATGGAVTVEALMTAESNWRPYCIEKYPPSTFTSDYQIKAALHRMWLNSVERRTALKNAEYKCEDCDVKQTKTKDKEVKLQVHHKRGHVNWARIIAVIREELLVPPEELAALCEPCHDGKHKPEKPAGEVVA